MIQIKNVIIYPVLLGLYPVLFIYSHNIGQVSFNEAVYPIAIISILTCIGWFSISLISKDIHKSALIVSVFLALFFSYGQVAYQFYEIVIHRILLFVWISAFLILSYVIVRTRRSFLRFSQVLNIFSALLIVFCLFNIINSKAPADTAPVNGDIINEEEKSISTRADSISARRDIYLIVLDAYGRSDILKDLYGYDNSEFLNFLEDSGFYVADKAVSNYCQTLLTFASSFNLSYLDRVAEAIGEENSSHDPLKHLIEKSVLIKLLKKNGYKIITFDEYANQQNRFTDLHLSNLVSMTPLYETLKNLTPIPYVFSGLLKIDSFEKHRSSILYILDTLPELPEMMTTPKFVFAHIPIPHPPFVFGPNGEPKNYEKLFHDLDADWIIRDGGITKAQYIERYRDQAIFLSKRIKKAIDGIIQKSDPEPIVVVMADHGPRSQVIWHDPVNSNVKEALSILSAYYLPEVDQGVLYPEISPVNTFRIILTQYFGKNYPPRPDRCYFSTPKYLYKFYDVTERVRGN